MERSTRLTYHAHSHATPQELDILIQELRFPSKGTSFDKVLGYLYNYIPYIKQEHNLRLVFASFLNSPVCFSPSNSFEESYKIVELFQVITEQKLKISQPTLKLKSWYSIIIKELQNFVRFDQVGNSWKALPIITGILLANGLREELHYQSDPFGFWFFYKKWDQDAISLVRECLKYSLSASHSKDTIHLTAICLSLVCDQGTEMKDLVLPTLYKFVLVHCIDIIFSDFTLGLWSYKGLLENGIGYNSKASNLILRKPVIRNLNKLSFLIEACLTCLPYDLSVDNLIDDCLCKMFSFNQRLCWDLKDDTRSFAQKNDPERKDAFWFLMKSILFSEVIITRGILTRFTNSSRLRLCNSLGRPFNFSGFDIRYKQHCLKILHLLYYLSPILQHVGQGGFDFYNYVYHLSVAIALNNELSGSQFEDLSAYLICDYREVNLYPQVLNNDYVTRCKVLFVLGLWETYLQQNNVNKSFVTERVIPICRDLVDHTRYTDRELMEASHSVILASLANPTVTLFLGSYLDYTKLMMRQFPAFLSSSQLSIALETIGRKILSHPAAYMVLISLNDTMKDFLEMIYEHCRSVSPDIPIPGNSESQETQSSLSIAASDEKPTMSEQHFTHRTKPNTIREATISAFIRVLPYMPLASFVHWLDKIDQLIQESALEEQNFLLNVFWGHLSENLDLNRSEVAIRWWYGTGRVLRTSKDVKL